MTPETTLEVRLPTPLLRLGLGKDEIERRVVEWLVLSLFVEDCILTGKAARLLNISHVAFLDLLRARGRYVDYSPDELAEEFAAAERLDVESSE